MRLDHVGGELRDGDILGVSKYEIEFHDDGNHAAMQRAARPSAEVPEDMPDTFEVDDEESWKIAEEIKRAREQREIDREAYEEERRMLDRDREQLAFDEHQKREDEFQLEQSKMRVKRRVPMTVP